MTEAKQRQAAYFNRTAKERPALSVGQTVRVRYDDSDWRKAEVARVLPHRSYEVRFGDGTTRRRTSQHVRFSSEPQIVIRTDNGDDTAAAGDIVVCDSSDYTFRTFSESACALQGLKQTILDSCVAYMLFVVVDSLRNIAFNSDSCL